MTEYPSPFSLNKTEKSAILSSQLLELTNFHIAQCPEYAKMLKGLRFDETKVNSYYDLPFLPVNLFKEFTLKSIPETDVFKVMTSSGTTGQMVSRIYLDKATASAQQKTLVKIVSSFTGSSRMPMMIIDCPSIISNRAMFSARGAGVLGFSIFGSDKIYALNDDMKINFTEIETFISKYHGKRILLFGFTFMIWLHFYKELETLGRKLDLSNAVLVHGGGWKKLGSKSISKGEFRQRISDICGLKDVHDYYGMVEQTGSIYMECEYGHLHASIYSDVITRRVSDFSVCDFGEKGIIQVLSILPNSYPGHSLLTEDEGTILGEDDCPCGRKGKYFYVHGRLPNAEIRGCSDTYATTFK